MRTRFALVGAALAVAYAAGRASTSAALTVARWQARTDSLTGIANRAGVEVELAWRVASRQPWALVLLDLDGFKQVNDAHGHAVGDAVLVAAARRLAGVTDPARDLVGRLGGDEFVIVASSPGSLAWLLGRDAAAAVRRPVAIGDLRVAVTASVGVVQALPGDTARAVLHSADVAMYAAKTSGGNQVVEFDPAAELVDVEVERPGVRLRDLTAAGRDVAGVRS